MIFEEKKVTLEELFSKDVQVGAYAIIPSFTLPGCSVEFNGVDVECEEYETPETKLYCIENKDGKRQYLFDNVLFNMSIAPFEDGKEKSFETSFLKKYLSEVFTHVFLKENCFEGELACDIPSKIDVFGDDNGEGMLDWFKEPKHRIAMYKDYSEWWWLSTKAVASAAYFCYVINHGNAHYYGAGYANVYVRPRFVIGA